MDTPTNEFAREVARELAETLHRQIAEGTFLPPPEYLDGAQAAAYLGGGLTAAALETMRKEKRGPRYSRPSHKIVRYRRRDLDAWLEAGAIDPSAQG